MEALIPGISVLGLLVATALMQLSSGGTDEPSEDAVVKAEVPDTQLIAQRMRQNYMVHLMRQGVDVSRL